MEAGGAETAGDGAGAAGRRVQDTVDKNGYRRRKRWRMNGQDTAQPIRTNIEMNIFFGDGSDESYETGRGLSNIVVEPLEEYYEE